jgi:hypothetical protein
MLDSLRSAYRDCAWTMIDCRLLHAEASSKAEVLSSLVAYLLTATPAKPRCSRSACVEAIEARRPVRLRCLAHVFPDLIWIVTRCINQQ